MAIDKNEIKVFFNIVNNFHDDVSVFKIFLIEIHPLYLKPSFRGVF